MSAAPGRTSFARNAWGLIAGNLVSALMVLARNILIARMISVEDFGIASTFAIAITLIETGTNLALDRMVVRDPLGGRRTFMAALHSIQLMRGVLGAFVIMVFAPLYASVMGVPDLTWAYLILAAVPLVRAASHLDMFRAQRGFAFGPFLKATLLSHGASLVAALPLAIWLPDFRVMLAAVILQQLVFVIMSHRAAASRYRLLWDPMILRKSLRFGLPLLLNGIVMFATLNGDQMLVGSFLGMETLGWFAVAFSLTLLPATIAANTLQSLLLPGLSRLRRHSAAERVQVRRILAITAATGATLVIGLAVAGPFAIDLLYGPRYHEAAQIIPLLALLQGLRLLKAGPAIIAIARGQTIDPLIANLPRLASVPCACLLLGAGGDVMTVINVALAGEALCVLTALLLLGLRGAARPAILGRELRHG